MQRNVKDRCATALLRIDIWSWFVDASPEPTLGENLFLSFRSDGIRDRQVGNHSPFAGRQSIIVEHTSDDQPNRQLTLEMVTVNWTLELMAGICMQCLQMLISIVFNQNWKRLISKQESEQAALKRRNSL